jgi:hypothetical protein
MKTTFNKLALGLGLLCLLAGRAESQSFTVSPATIPANHAGNITLTLTGTGTAWGGGTVFTVTNSVTGTTTLTLLSQGTATASIETLVVKTGAGVGTYSVSDGTLTASASTATATFASNISSVSTGGIKNTIIFTGTNTLWLADHPLPSASGIGGITFTGGQYLSNTSMVYTMTSGNFAATGSLVDSSTNASTGTNSFSQTAPTTPQAIDRAVIGTPRARITGTTVSTTTNNSNTYRLRYTIEKDAQYIRLVFGNYNTASGGENVVAAPVSITIKVGISLNNASTPTRLYFGGNDTGTIAAGGVLVSDIILFPVYQRGQLYVTTFVTSSNISKLPAVTQATPALSAGEGEYDSNTTDNSLTSTDPVTGGLFCYGPLIVIGDATTVQDSIAFIGDSIGAGASDIFGNSQLYGSLQLCFTEQGYTPIDVTMPGETAQSYATTSLSAGRDATIKGAKIAIVQYAMNDIRGTRTTTQLEADLTTIYTKLRTAGFSEIYGVTCEPYTASTDNWLTTANQTPAGMSATTRPAVNNWIRGKAGGLIDGYIEWADQMETSRDSGIWKVPSAPALTGTLTSATLNTFTDINQSFSVNVSYGAYQQYTVKITGGTGSGQIRALSVNTNLYTTTLAIASNWTTIPDNTSTYSLYQTYTPDGIHPYKIGHDLVRAILTPVKIALLRNQVTAGTNTVTTTRLPSRGR